MTMDLTFLGGAREVTGSCILVRAANSRFLVDCGMFQGGAEGDRRNARKFPFEPSSIDFVLCTHAHIDHSGILPKLVKEGFRGGVHCTDATADLLNIMLPDSGHIQEKEAEWKSRKRQRKGRRVAVPLYTQADARVVAERLRPTQYGVQVLLRPGITATFLNAGHILGSSIVVVDVEDGGPPRRLVFSGDLGHRGLPILRDPVKVDRADVVVMESTYGNRVHKGMNESMDEFAHAINDTLRRKGGNVIIPAFAVGRTQDVLYALLDLTRKGIIEGITVYVDSPLAIEASRITMRNHKYFDDETCELLEWREANPDALNIVLVRDAEDSMRLNQISGAVIVAGSGMCNAGRIKHHLKHNLWRSECTVVFTGFQALGTLGRILVDGIVSEVKLFGEEIAIRSRIVNFKTMSSHADKNGLIKWLDAIEPKPERVFVLHGEHDTCLSFALMLTEEGDSAVAPKYSAIYDLLTGKMVYEGRDLIGHATPGDIDRRESSVYQRLMLAGTRLIEVITRNRGGTNKDLGKFADQIDALSNKWDR
ncbi:MAG: MBL fold metallo-hydrolase [Syntrophorhabdaceae bacterium]|nr:MBL fold metallo-hydrolase [Syntrophorhabdaceae bacterium]